MMTEQHWLGKTKPKKSFQIDHFQKAAMELENFI